MRKSILKTYAIYICIGLAAGVANGLFGSGGGTIAVPAMILFLNEEEHKAHATAISIVLPLTIVSILLYVNKNFINWNITYKVILGGIAGGFIGARLLKKFTKSMLSKAFGAFMIVAGVRMLIS